MQIRCKKCCVEKSELEFYANAKKKNGRESHCKACVLGRKKSTYRKNSNLQRKTKLLRLQQRVRVLHVDDCTLHEVFINSQADDGKVPLMELAEDLICTLQNAS